MKTKLFQNYTDVKNQIIELQLQESLLKEKLIEELRNAPGQKIENEFGKFKVAKRITYSYSDKIEEMQEKVKLAQVKEVEKGIAKIKSQTEYLTWN